MTKPNMTDYSELAKVVSKEIGEVLSSVKPDEVSHLARQILQAKKVFIFGVGRVFLSLQFLAKRLVHLGIDAQLVGSVTEKHIDSEDLLIIASGSGESVLPVAIARLAKKSEARLALVTSAQTSTIKSISDLVVHLPCPTKNVPGYGVKSIQSMTNLFDQSLHLFSDILTMILQAQLGLTESELWQHHANLE